MRSLSSFGELVDFTPCWDLNEEEAQEHSRRGPGFDIDDLCALGKSFYLSDAQFPCSESEEYHNNSRDILRINIESIHVKHLTLGLTYNCV